MAKRTNRVAWGLVVVLAGVMLGGVGLAVYYHLQRRHLNEALVEASYRGNTAAVRYLLSRGANVDAAFGDLQVSALFAAADQGHTEIVKLLLEHSASIDAKTNTGQTALSQAASTDETGVVVSLLIAKGAAVNTRDILGMTPLHYAAWRGMPTATRLLLDAGAEVNAKDNRGRSPLAIALDGQKLSSGKRTNEQRRLYPLFTKVVHLLKKAGGKPY
jgi:ankyrin repeat protein